MSSKETMDVAHGHKAFENIVEDWLSYLRRRCWAHTGRVVSKEQTLYTWRWLSLGRKIRLAGAWGHPAPNPIQTIIYTATLTEILLRIFQSSSISLVRVQTTPMDTFIID